MRIAIVSQYFWPESFIINQLSKTLALQGHQVVVLTGKPNYPSGEVFPGYTIKGTQREWMDNVEVIRVPLRPRKSSNGISLLFNYISFIWSGLLRFPFLVRNREFDVIFVFAPSPITSAIPAIFLKYLKRAHLAVWVQDLWPESLSATGFIKNKVVLKLVSYLVRWIYACSDTLLIQSEAFIKPLGVLTRLDKVIYFPNVIDDMQKKVKKSENHQLPQKLLTSLENDFCLVFAGNIGKAQSIETLIHAAKQLDCYPDIKIVFVGDGSMLEWAQQEVARLHLNNIIFAGAFPLEIMPSIFAKAKGLLVSLKADEIFSYTIPSKVQAYLSAGRPIIASVDGEAARVIEEAGAGLTCLAEDSEGLTNRIVQLFKMSQLEHETLGLNGREYFLANFEMKRQCIKLVDILKTRIADKREKVK